MRKILIVLVLFAFICTCLPADSFAGPWTVRQGKVWLEVFTRYFTSNKNFDSKYNLSKWNHSGRSAIYDIEVKVEYGVTDNLNFLLGVPYSWSNWRNDWDEANSSDNPKHEGFKPISFGAKYKFMDKPATAAVQVKAFLQPRNVDRNKSPQLNEYGDAIEFRGLLGNSWQVFEDKKFYVSGEAGYLLRSDWACKSEYANAFPVFVEMGFEPLNWLLWKAEVDCLISHPGTGKIKDTYTWRTGPVFMLTGAGFSSVDKGSSASPADNISLNVELQYGQTFLGRGDPDDRWNETDPVSAAQEFILKVQFLF